MTNGFNESLEREINEAGINQDAREAAAAELDIPEKFREKSAEEIIRSYQELEKAYGRQAQTVGQLRKSVDQLLELNSTDEPERREPPKPLSVDDLYENADDAIRRAVREETAADLNAVKKELNDTKRQLTLRDFESRHPNWRQLVADPSFANWVADRPYRQKLAAAADQYDFDAAEELFSMYEDMDKGRKQEDQQERRSKLKDASLESGAARQSTPVKTYSRYELMEKRIRAKRGDRNADMWLRENSTAIQRAYEEGRIVD
jgi:hypothetical protein